MIQTLSEPVSVTFNKYPLTLTWHNRDYPVTRLGLHHTIHNGRVLHHIFSVTSQDLFFRLNLNTENLSWTLEELSDGLPD